MQVTLERILPTRSDGGPASLAKLWQPFQFALDGLGGAFIPVRLHDLSLSCAVIMLAIRICFLHIRFFRF